MVGLAKQGKLTLSWALAELLNDGLLNEDNVGLLEVLGQSDNQQQQVLIAIAERNLPNRKLPKQTLSLEFLVEWLAIHVALPYYRIDPLKIDVAAVTGVVSYAYAKRFNVLPVEVSSTKVTFATAEPFVTEWQHEMEHILRKQIVLVVANPRDIERYLLEFFTLSRSISGAAKDRRHIISSGGVQNLEQLMDLGGQKSALDANDQHVVNIVDWLLQYAFEQRASDIHLEPRREQANVRFRIDGMLHQVHELPSAVMAAVTSRIKILGRMDVAEKRRPQDGRLKTRNPEGKEIELRLSTMPSAFGEKLVMRIFDPDVLLKNSTELGFNKQESEIWQKLIHQPNGIVLVTGPTGSGKTTTLYSSLRQLATQEVNLCTIEDPIELVEPSFNQMQVQHNIELDFAAGVRTLLRQDPDIIMIGEIRDLETAEMATQAALTGHLVLSTLHTNDAPAAITRLLELGVPPYLVNSTLLGVVAQRLVRLLCSDCKTTRVLKEKEWQRLVAPWKVKAPEVVYEPVGCLECRNTGYLGRSGIYELFQLSAELKQLVRPEVDIADLRRLALRQGMHPMRLAGAQKVAQGITTIEEILRVTPPALG